MKRGQFCGPGQMFINDKLAASGEWKGVQLIKSFKLDSELVRKIEADVCCAEQAGLSAKLAAAKDELPAEHCHAKLIEDCRLAALANNAAEVDKARQARALKQVISRPSSSLSVAQDLQDVDQARPVPEFFSFHPDIQCIQAHSSSSSDEDDGDVENGDCSADDELQTSRDAINVEGATAVIAMKFD